MKPFHVAALTLALMAASSIAGVQAGPPLNPPAAIPAPESPAAMPLHHPAGMPPMGDMGSPMAAQQGKMPQQPGQAAFGAIQEIVRMLEADPHTNWSKVNIDALRQHLIDMNEVTMRAAVHKTPIDNGLRMVITGHGRTRAAIQRMVPDHAMDINGLHGWAVRAVKIRDGAILTVTASNPAEVEKIRALGFMGIMVQGSHQPHHLAIAKGEPMPMGR